MAHRSSDRSGAVLFDIDGTLVDTNYLHVAAWLDAFRHVGHPVNGADIHRAIGMGSPQLLERLLGADVAGELGERVKAEHGARYRRNFETLRAFEGARMLVQTLAGRARAVLASSASPDELKALRATLDVDDVVDAIIGGGDVDAAKPQPDVVQVALERVGVGPDAALFVGDTVWDIEACEKAGVPCIAVLTGGIGDAELREAGAVAVYRSVADLLANLEDSPLRAVLRPPLSQATSRQQG
jgi:HAD superfamily hydrolase (TIGR01549 family)